MKKRLWFIPTFVLSLTLLAGCAGSSSVNTAGGDEEDEALTLTIEDPDYYSTLKGRNITINVYNWGEYISDGSDGMLDVNEEFTKLTGIKVNYTTYATNEELYAKLKGGGSSYDVIIPSDYMISRMINENMLEPLDFKNIPNMKNIMENFKNPEYDPDQRYSVPYTWGTVGIIYDNTVVDEEEIGWDILWNEDYADRILMFDNPRDAFAIAENMLGYSLNTEDPEELEKAAAKLTEQKKVVQAYVMDEIFDKMGAGEAIIAPYYAGDARTLLDEYDNLSFVIPASGTNLFFDAMCVPKGAKNKRAAEMYINFMCEADIAYSTTEYIGYSTPNQAAFDLLDEEEQTDEVAYPDDEFLAEKTEVFRNLSNEANQKMQDLWTDMKSAEEQTPNRVIVPVFMLLCIILSVTVIIRRHIKAKKDIF
ncbi:MAG: ABC transporter substrate-binding protein [Oscillospiraceae bacterium]|nr:ABC transporter substrate-binding protein [Oscillospiraceae bacterium]